MAGSKATKIENSCQAMKEKWSSKKLTQKDLAKLDKSIRETLTFSLTAGMGFQSVPVKERILNALHWTIRKVSEKLLVQGVITLFGLTLAGLAFGVDPIDYFKALIERLRH